MSRLQVFNPYLTIAGQTSPGGVWFGADGGNCLFISTHDVIVRYVGFSGDNPRIQPGQNTGTWCFEIASGSAYNIVVDHTSSRWYSNKSYPIFSNEAGNVHDVTFQWNLEYEPNVDHPVGVVASDATSGSSLATTNIDWHHNMFVNIDHRSPFIDGGTLVRWVNNLTYNWNHFAALVMGGTAVDFIGNEWFDGNLSQDTVHTILGNVGNDPKDPTNNCSDGPCDNPGPPSFYLLNNIGRSGNKPGGPSVTPTNVPNDSGQVSLTQRGWEGGETGDPNSHGPIPSGWFRVTPNPAQRFPILADPVAKLDELLLPSVGNSKRLDCDGNLVANRDSDDERIIAQYRVRGPGQLFSYQYRRKTIAVATPCIESLHDGIPDQWKKTEGLSTTDPKLHKTLAPNGYTWLENYLDGQHVHR
jgi:pectate lyase